ERVVVYLPLPQKQAEILRPFFATSRIFRVPLYKFLRQQGLDFPDDPHVAHELRALLPRLAARSVGKGRAFWEYNLANLERARETLLGNFDDALLRFLACPQATLTDLKREQLDGLFFAQLETTYSLSATAEDDPDDVACRLTAQLVLVRAFTDAGQPEDFPYKAQLPAPLYFDRCLAFLDRWQRDGAYKAAYVRWARELEKDYDLAGWVARLPTAIGLGLKATFADVEASLWKEVETVMAELEGETAWHSWLKEHQALFQVRAENLWTQEGQALDWGLLVRAADLLSAIRDARAELDRMATPGALLRRYAQAWWRIDQDYRRLREALDASPHACDSLRTRCTLSYRDILRRMNDRFCILLEAEGGWPPRDMVLPPQEGFWAEITDALGKGRRIAVMFVDALRYELAQELREMLQAEGAGSHRELIARLAAIPTVTPIGMAALLPGGDHRRVGYTSGWEVTIEGSGNLRDKETRKRWLERHLPNAHLCDLDKLLNTPSDRIPKAEVYIVFDTTLDTVGETASKIAWNTFSTLLQSVKKGVHRLLGLGVEQVHVVADHGFLLLEEIGEHEKVGVRSVSALAKKSRYVVGRGLGRTDQLRFPVPGSKDLEAWFPRGIGCFRTPGPYNYVHGGLSLQELVVPHLRVVQQVLGRRVGIRVDLPRVIRSAQFRVRLEPVVTDLLDRPRQVELVLEKAGEPIIPPLSCVVNPDSSTDVHVFLPMGRGLEPGDRVRWVLRDAVTGEVLAEQEAVSQVDLW
ncbi:MAG TPA: PglZ domain-containing protein, partial [Anaerolineae bacterium]|nr:PglZ domain-containing protein [Anaerolineae bacterium]